jgi:hypothetical protein
VHHVDALLEPLERPHLRVVSRQDPRGRHQRRQHPRERGQQAIDRLRQRLHHQVVAIPIDDERGEQIGLTVYQPVGGCVEPQRITEAHRLLQTRSDQGLVRHHLAARQHANRNLRSVAEERVADDALTRADDADDVAAGGVGL